MLVADLAAGLKRRGTDMAVITDTVGDLPPSEVIAGTPVYRLNLVRALRESNLLGTLSNMQEITRIIAVERPDILHVHSATQASVFYLDRILRKQSSSMPVVVTQHGTLEEKDKTQVTHRMILGARMLTGVSQAALASAVEFTGRKAESRRIYNGFEMPAEFPAGRIPPPKHRLLCVGRMQREKGFDIAIDALAILRKQGIVAQLTLVGYGEDQPQFESQACMLGIGEHVAFRGAIDRMQVRRLMAESSILLAPSRTREGFCLAAAEAASVGTPCVVSDVGGLPETVDHEQTGLVVPHADVGAVAGGAARILSDPKLWARLSAAAHERARAKFGLDRCVDSYADAYREILSHNETKQACDTL